MSRVLRDAKRGAWIIRALKKKLSLIIKNVFRWPNIWQYQSSYCISNTTMNIKTNRRLFLRALTNFGSHPFYWSRFWQKTYEQYLPQHYLYRLIDNTPNRNHKTNKINHYDVHIKIFADFYRKTFYCGFGFGTVVIQAISCFHAELKQIKKNI